MHYPRNLFGLEHLKLTSAIVLLWTCGAVSPLHAAPVLPSDIPGLQAWYRVDQGVTTSAGAVSGWLDSSTNGRNMAQGNSSLRPLLAYDTTYGFSVVDFTSTTRWLSAGSSGGPIHSNTDGFTAIYMVRPGSVTTGAVASQFNAAVNQRQWRASVNIFDLTEAPGDSWVAGTTAPYTGAAANQWNVYSGVWTPGQKPQAYLNGQWVGESLTKVDAMATANVQFLLGAGSNGSANQLNGAVSEVMLFNRALSDAERQGVEEYLALKYAPSKTETRHAGSFFEADVNFEGVGANASNRPLPPRYHVDAGHAFTYYGDGIWYGWDRDNTTGGRNRNSSASPDERFDTLNHMQPPAGGVNPATWEMAVPDGDYWVRAVFGESSGGTATNHVTIQGLEFTDADPGIGSDWDEYFGQFTVAGGRLSIAPRSDVTNVPKISFVQVREVIKPDIAINFQPGTSTSELPSHYLVDDGSAFGDRGNGLTYGWVDVATGEPYNNTGNARSRGSHPDGRRYTTFNHFRNGVAGNADWAIELPNGLYEVLAVFGESQLPSTSTNNMWIGDVAFYDPDPGLGEDWDLFMGRVSVQDGLLVLRPMGNSGKINFIEITMIPEPSTAMLLAFGLLIAVAGAGRKNRRQGA
ncbi:MAG: LamG-like jellyroll fold domain-containing protein [Thermoguttaceae bacterium]|jgi:hypothetical protein|nr:LamG-like jellyroll fold domain-containing protein [Thermoguttaceae bacterium]